VSEAELPADSAPLHYNRGLDLIAEGRMKEARKALLKAAELDKKDADALCELGRLEIEAGRLDTAVEFLDKALGRKPEHASALNNRAVADFLSGNYAESAAGFRSAVESDPELTDAWYNLADSCEEIGDMQGRDEARRRYRILKDES